MSDVRAGGIGASLPSLHETEAGGGTPLTDSEAGSLLRAAGLVDVADLRTPGPPAPAAWRPVD